MNLTETFELLSHIAVIDNRKFGDDTVIAWQEILGDVEFADAREAVRRHFAESSHYLMPVHVARGAAEVDRERRRRARLAAEAQQAIEAKAPGERSAEVEALIADLRDSLPSPDPIKYRRAETLGWDRAREREARQIEPNPDYDPAVQPEPAV